MAGRLERFIVFTPKTMEAVPHHYVPPEPEVREALGEPVPSFMNGSLVPEADMGFGVRHVKCVPANAKLFVDPHKHPASSAFGIIGDLTLEVTLEDEKYEVSGPAGVFVPAGIMHALRPVRGSGYLVSIYRSGEYV